MSNQVNERRCQWEGCTSDATRHLEYRKNEEPEIECNDKYVTMTIKVTPEDFCDLHVGEMQRLYGKGDVSELG